MPKCIECGASVRGKKQPGQDNSFFVCDACQDKKNLKAWKEERKKLIELGKSRSPSQSRRLKRVEEFIAKVEG